MLSLTRPTNQGILMASPTRQTEQPDPARRQVLAACADNYGVGDESEGEWPNNMFSRRLVVYRTGHIARQNEPVHIDVVPEELATCQRIASELKSAVGDRDCGLGSESHDELQPFFFCINRDEPVPDTITPDLIRAKFNGTILPPVTITVEPLDETSSWWQTLQEYNQEFENWRMLMPLFADHPGLHGAVFVEIGEYGHLMQLADDGELPDGAEISPSCLPRLFLALTAKGSIVGLFGFIVQT